MCFSSTASFGASGVLLVIGVASIIKTSQPRQLLFAVIPLIFAVQQFTEGFLWLSLEGRLPGYEKILTYSYLFFAQVLWPVWIPLAFLWLENDNTRRIFLKTLTGFGFLVGLYLAYALLYFNVSSEIVNHHIKYRLDFPQSLQGYGNPFYGLATVVPIFVSGVKGMKIFGLLIILAYLVSFFYFKSALISVWCYFAAVISISIWFLLPVSNPDQVKEIN